MAATGDAPYGADVDQPDDKDATPAPAETSAPAPAETTPPTAPPTEAPRPDVALPDPRLDSLVVPLLPFSGAIDPTLSQIVSHVYALELRKSQLESLVPPLQQEVRTLRATVESQTKQLAELRAAKPAAEEGA